jgi:hypothetical protein
LADWTIEGNGNVTLAVGRQFVPADDDPGATLVVILSDQLWRRVA